MKQKISFRKGGEALFNNAIDMDISLIVGIIIGFILIVLGIQIQNLKYFIDVPSLLITVGGTLAALIASFELKTLLEIPKHLKIMVSKSKFKPNEVIDVLVELAQEARKNGLLALEDKANEQADPFLKNSLMMIVDAVDAEKVKEMMENELAYVDSRHQQAIAFYAKGAALAPAFGMIGTLIGLINMLKSMNMDSGGANQIGEGMSVALLTTFYGTVFANLIFLPMEKKLQNKHEQELLYKEIIVEGILAIQFGENPRFIEEKLHSFLSQKQIQKAAGKGGKQSKEE